MSEERFVNILMEITDNQLVKDAELSEIMDALTRFMIDSEDNTEIYVSPKIDSAITMVEELTDLIGDSLKKIKFTEFELIQAGGCLNKNQYNIHKRCDVHLQLESCTISLRVGDVQRVINIGTEVTDSYAWSRDRYNNLNRITYNGGSEFELNRAYVK